MAAMCSFMGCARLKWNLVANVLDIPKPKYAVTVDKNVMIPMSDGIRLAADIYRPDASGKFPVIIVRTPYGKRNPNHKYEFAGRLFASQGFAFTVQDVRGKFDSEGVYYPYINESKDGYDTLEWAAKRDWSTGKIGTYGFSYWGSTQWLAAPTGSTRLKAMVPIVTAQDPYNRWIYNGIFRINDVLVWHYENAKRYIRDSKEIDWDSAVQYLPLIRADNALGQDISYYNDWIKHPVPGPYWDNIRVDDKVSKITAPALIIDGWYDYYLDSAIKDFNRMISNGGSKEARMSRLIIGPWTHTSKSKFDDVDFGKSASFMQQVKAILGWFQYWLKDEDNGVADEDPIKIFIMGKNEWRSEKEWPLKRTKYVKYYLHSNGCANGIEGNGLLDTELPGKESSDQFIYDPANPVPSIGGTSIYGKSKPGPADQREIEIREDVLIYSTPPLKGDIEVTGPVSLILYAASSAKDTDFAATLVDVYPDGKAINLKTGILRARFRNSLTKPSFLEKDKVYKLDLEIGATSILFKKGHRIRLQVSSSSFPEFGRNLNTGAPIGMTAKIEKAKQTIYHISKYPSYLLLPVIPVDQ